MSVISRLFLSQRLLEASAHGARLIGSLDTSFFTPPTPCPNKFQIGFSEASFRPHFLGCGWYRRGYLRLYYTILHYTMLYYIVVYPIMLIILYDIQFHCIISYPTVLYYIVLYYTGMT